MNTRKEKSKKQIIQQKKKKQRKEGDSRSGLKWEPKGRKGEARSDEFTKKLKSREKKNENEGGSKRGREKENPT